MNVLKKASNFFKHVSTPFYFFEFFKRFFTASAPFFKTPLSLPAGLK
jgi:hypothetical protein